MKNNSNLRIIKIIQSVFKIRQWFDWDRTKSFLLFGQNAAKDVFSVKNAKKKERDKLLVESFESARTKLNLSHAELLKQQRALLCWSLLMCAVTLAVFLYSIYHFYLGNIRAGFCSFIIMLLSAVLAFRYHFWYYQIKNHKLGCTVQEWFKKGILGAANE